MSELAELRARSRSAAWQALGTGIVLRVSDPAMLERARGAVERELAAVDLACSRFRADSELSRANHAEGRAVSVGPLLLEALEVALRAAALTDGDVDPTVGRALELAGYDRDFRELPPPTAQTTARPPRSNLVSASIRADWRAVAVDRARATVRVPAGMHLDLGASAKAWAADRAARAAADAGGCGVLVSVGGDIATCGPAPESGWRIRVTDDHRSDAAAEGQTISIRSGGIATSSTMARRWQHAGRTMHHIIDPATGAPVRASWRTVSVAAASATDANIATTAAIVRASAAPSWLAGLGLPARLLAWNGEITTVGGWPADRAEPAERRLAQ
jgi:thiamine biosynthesis lipoprotein ApbE